MLPAETVDVEITFHEEGEKTSVAELAVLLSQLENGHNRFESEVEPVMDALPVPADERMFEENDDEKDIFIGRLYRSGIFENIGYNNNPGALSPSDVQSENIGLEINKINKSSPLIISLTGGGMFIAFLWIIEGIEINQERHKKIDQDGNSRTEVRTEWSFDATSTTELLEAIKNLFKSFGYFHSISFDNFV